MSVELTERLGLPVAWSPPLPAPAELAAATFARELDRRWRRTSYTDITAAAHDARVASEPEETTLDDEPDEPIEAAAGSALPLGDVPGSAAFGTFVHTVFEETDFAAADLDLELTSKVREALARRPVEIPSQAAIVAGLRAAIETPLGPLVGGVRLRDVARADRLDELGFELPLAGGDEPLGRVTPQAIGAVLRAHLPPDDPLYALRRRGWTTPSCAPRSAAT